ncbi:MAG: metallophosphoesterase [Candidatus Pacearchaeota archaeon]
MKYEFFYKTVFFPEKGILVVGDLHLGFYKVLKTLGVLNLKNQLSEIISDFKTVFNQLKKKGYSLKKIIILGDINHFFITKKDELSEFSKLISFLTISVKKENIIIIKGNHDVKKDFLGITPKLYYIEEDTIFTHGHQQYSEVLDKKIRVIVFGHLHPSIMAEIGPNKEIDFFKCFLEGEYDGKTFLVIPSFFRVIEGTLINNYDKDYIESFSIIPKKDMMNSKIYLVNEREVQEIGKINEIFVS